MPTRVIHDVVEARRTILRREPLTDVPASDEMLEQSERTWGERLTPDQVVGRILDRVRTGGDAALREIGLKLDGVDLPAFEVPRAEIRAAYEAVPTEVVEALRVAVTEVRRFHEKHLPKSWLDFAEGGALGQLVTPIERVGLMVPGGRAAYPSTVVMLAVPARVAGCREVVMCTPPRSGGRVNPATLVAADLAGVDRVFALGGAQAVAAMAFGTETVPRVDKIVGPGNLFVVLAKRRVFGMVGIDQLPGPTETLIVADDSADPRAAAADMLAQAEHDPLASAILVTPFADQAAAIAAEIERQLGTIDRAEIARQSLERGGGIVVVESLEQALEIANEYAPEHLCLMLRDPWSALAQVRNAGGVFVGETSMEAVGDYTAGPSHVMPTGGTARFSSPTTVFDYLKFCSVFALGRPAVERLGPPAAVLARAEGLTAHAQAIDLRLGAHNDG